MVQEFNKGVYDYIIATDESSPGGAEQDTTPEVEVEDEDNDADEEPTEERMADCLGYSSISHFSVTSTQRDGTNDAETPVDKSRKRKRNTCPPQTVEPSPKRKQRRKGGPAHEYGVTRGVDFIDVACVLNFDLPSSSRSYTHRVGRTARAGRTGMALSFVVDKEQWGKNKIVGCVPSAKEDETVFTRIENEQAARGSKIKEYKFDMKQVEAFRYRMEDAMRSVTRSAIKEARIKELKAEILNSQKLKVRACFFFPSRLCSQWVRHISKTIL